VEATLLYIERGGCGGPHLSKSVWDWILGPRHSTRQLRRKIRAFAVARKSWNRSNKILNIPYRINKKRGLNLPRHRAGCGSSTLPRQTPWRGKTGLLRLTLTKTSMPGWNPRQKSSGATASFSRAVAHGAAVFLCRATMPGAAGQRCRVVAHGAARQACRA
jgi:hypothetical protein